MFVRKITKQNFRLFSACDKFEIDELNIPDSTNEGSGLTVVVGENGCGKTALLDSFALPLLQYKADSVHLHDFQNPNNEVSIELFANHNFEVSGTMPKGSFKSKGFSFEAHVRSRGTKSYLSSVVVSDQKFIRADGETKPKDGSPDLRVSVNNPFKGQRFSENDVLFLDKNRISQTRSGTFNSTRFDRLMEDFSYQYIKGSEEIQDISKRLDDIKNSVDNQFLADTITKFQELSGSRVTLSLIDNWQPFSKAFFAEKKENNQQIPLNMLGSGYEMIFALLYSFYLSQQGGKQLIILIDEPELHLHPSLQEKFVKILLEFSKTAQIILTTHSPLLVKQLFYNENIKTCVLAQNNGAVNVMPIKERVLPYVSANEINFLAFSLATEEYHNELFEELRELKGEGKLLKRFDNEFFIQEKKQKKDCRFWGEPNEVSIHTFIRNQIHYRKDNGKAEVGKLRSSTIKMREYLRELVQPDE